MAEETWALRRDVLHPMRPLPIPPNPLDTVPGALHLGWFETGRLVGVGSIGRHPLELEPDAIAWFLRGMAVSQQWRNRGIGSGLLSALVDYAGGRDPNGIAWCQARIHAEAFYARHGFRRLDLVDLPQKGPRYRMRRLLRLA